MKNFCCIFRFVQKIILNSKSDRNADLTEGIYRIGEDRSNKNSLIFITFVTEKRICEDRSNKKTFTANLKRICEEIYPTKTASYLLQLLQKITIEFVKIDRTKTRSHLLRLLQAC